MKVTKWLCEAVLASSITFSIGFVSCSPEVETKEIIKTETVEVEKEKKNIVAIDKKIDESAPANVTNLTATNKDGAILLTWTDNTTDSDIYGYEVTYDTNTSSRVVLNPISNTSIVVAPGTGGCYINNLNNGTEYTFTVKSIDTSGNKSGGLTVNATPSAINPADTIKIELTTPQELTNTTITVTAKITSASRIKKVVYKKNGSVNAAALLSDTEAHEATQLAPYNDTIWTFVADDKAFWTVAAIDDTGREETAQIYTQTIDKIPPAEVSNISSQYSESQNSIKITWDDPADTNGQYDSPFDHVIVTYTVDDNTEVKIVNQTVAKSIGEIEITDIDSSAECYQLLIHTVDILGNTSKGKLNRCYIGNTIITTADNVVEKIEHMTRSGTVKVTGEITGFWYIANAVKSLSPDIFIKLDFDEATTSQSMLYPLDFNHCKTLVSIILPNDITSIERGAFDGCSSLTSVTIPDDVTSIGAYAFEGCSSLTSVKIPDRVTSIGDAAFAECTALSTVYIPDSVRTIGAWAFCDCHSLTSVNIPEGVTAIEQRAFYNCIALSSVTIPDGVISIDFDAFGGCNSLTSVTIPESIKTIGRLAFNSLTSLYYKGTIASWLEISYDSEPLQDVQHFYINNSEVRDVVIPDGVTTIGDYTFYGFNSLTSITVPDSVTTIGSQAFWNCASLTNVYYTGTLAGWLGISCNSITLSNIQHFYINNSEVTDVVIPNGVTNIRDGAFYGCTSLTSVTIPDSVTSIGNSAFATCKSLTTLNIGSSVNSIGNESFSECSTLTSVTIPVSVTAIGDDAFNNCAALKNIYYTGTIADWLKISCDMPVFSQVEHFYINNSELTEVVIPAGVTSIKKWAFYNFKSLANVTIPNTVTTIEHFAFSGCDFLSSVTIPESVTTIDSFAFDRYSNLTTINYKGTEEQWETLKKNGNFIGLTINCNYTGE